MIILGIDPGTTAAGFAVIDATRGAPVRLNAAGLLPITATDAAGRLAELGRELERVIENHKPAALAVEKLFFTRNVKTGMAVAEARGVILLTGARAGLRVYEYTPLEVKKTVTGDGGADKLQVKKMVQLTLKSAAPERARDDVFDAIAVALTCAFRERDI